MTAFKGNGIYPTDIKINKKDITLKLPLNILNYLGINPKDKAEVYVTAVGNVLQISSQPCLSIPVLPLDTKYFKKQGN